MTKLTKTYIDRLALPEGKDGEFHWDTEVKGFGLRVSPTGKVSYLVQGRVHGRSARITIGPHGVFTVDQAREVARENLRSMRMGIDPREVAKQKKATAQAEAVAGVTLQEVCDAYVSRPGKLKASSQAEIKRHVATTFEAWKDKPIASITEDDCRKRYREMLTKGLRGKAPAPGQANQGFSVLRALINFAARQYKKADGSPLILRNPASALKDDWVTLPERKTRIPESKIGAVWNALQQWRKVAYTRDTESSIDLVIFLLLTGARIGEAAALEWERVNIDEGWWHLPDPKNRNPVWLPLSAQAAELLKTRRRIKDNPFVFTSWGECKHISDPRDTMKKLSAVAGTKITPHDLRRTFTTFGIAQCSVELHKIELLTNHVPKGVTARHYLETSHLQYLKPEVQRIADWIEEQGRIAKGDNVIAMAVRQSNDR